MQSTSSIGLSNLFNTNNRTAQISSKNTQQNCSLYRKDKPQNKVLELAGIGKMRLASTCKNHILTLLQIINTILIV